MCIMSMLDIEVDTILQTQVANTSRPSKVCILSTLTCRSSAVHLPLLTCTFCLHWLTSSGVHLDGECLQALPGALYAATRLGFLNIAGNPLTISPQERQWLLTSLQRNYHAREDNLKVCNHALHLEASCEDDPVACWEHVLPQCNAFWVTCISLCHVRSRDAMPRGACTNHGCQSVVGTRWLAGRVLRGLPP